MKRDFIRAGALVITLAVGASQALACGGQCRTSGVRYVQPSSPQVIQAPVIQGPAVQNPVEPQVGQEGDFQGQPDQEQPQEQANAPVAGVTWDLPADAGSNSKENQPIVRSVPTAPTPAPARRVAATVRPAATSQSFNDRVAQAVAVQQTLKVQNARLQKKHDELDAWDATAQEKFQRAFGTTDEGIHQRVLQLVDQQIARNNQTLNALADRINMEFYLQSKRAR